MLAPCMRSWKKPPGLLATRRPCISPPARAIIRRTRGSSTKRAAEEIACGLRQLGIGKGDTVALHSETRAEFYLADLGVLDEWFHRGGALHHLSVRRSSQECARQPRQSGLHRRSEEHAGADRGGRPRSAHRIALDFADRRIRGRHHAGATASEGARRAEERSASIREDPRGSARRKIPRFCISPPAPPANRKWAW